MSDNDRHIQHRHVISQAQFHSNAQIKRDPNDSGEVDHGQGGKPRFSGAKGSKTMRIAAGHLPPPQRKHRHHRKNSPKTRRAR